MSIATTSDLVDSLRRSRLLEPEHLQELTSYLQTRFTEPRGLAKELVQRGWLTPFQVNQLLQGKLDHLLLGPYVLLERLGGGAMGQVFKARQQRVGRIVALKVIDKQRLADPDAMRRFRREIEATARLEHPNAVFAYDADQAGDAYFFAMEFIEGTDLDKLVKQRGPLHFADACEYIRQAALALQHAHEQGLVHRNIKPANLMLANTANAPTIKVLDMGLARLQFAMGEDSSQTLFQEGAVFGTPDYIAPEQAVNAHRVDIRADLYSLGCTFYFLLTGQAPFPGGSLAEKLIKHQFEEPARVEQLRPDVPAAAAAIVRRLMTKRPEDRYQTPAELITGLTTMDPVESKTAAASNGKSPKRATLVAEILRPAPADSAPAPTNLVFTETASSVRPRRTRTRKRPWLLIGSCAGVLLVGAFLLLVATRTGKDAEPDDASPRKEQGRGLDSVAELDRKKTREGAFHVSASAEKRPASKSTPQSGDKRQPAVGTAKNSEKAPAKGGNPAVIEKAKLDNPEKTVPNRDGNRPVKDRKVARENGPLPLMKLPSILDKLDAKAIAAAVRFPNQPAELVAVLGGFGDRKRQDGTSVAFSPDGRFLAAGAPGGGIRLWSLPDLGKPKLLEGQKGESRGLAFSRDGKRLASVGLDPAIRIWNVAGPAPSAEKAVRSDILVGGMSMTPTGQLVACAGAERILLWDLRDSEPKGKLVIRTNTREQYSVAFSPDGKLLASGGLDGIWLWTDLDMDPPKQRAHMRAHRATALGFAPDGKTLASGHGVYGKPDAPGQVKLWDLGEGEPKPRDVLEGHDAEVRDISFAPDGRVLASGAADGGVILWEAASGNRLRSWRFPGQIRAIAFAPDGRHLAVANGSSVYILRLGSPLG